MSKKKFSDFFDNPVFITFSLFFLIFIFALPLLWKSKRFTKHEKFILTILSLVEFYIILNKISIVFFKYFDRLTLINGIITEAFK